MTSGDKRRDHWQQVWATRAPDSVSWFEARAEQSLELLTRIGARPADPILDVGAGASVLVDGLLATGFRHLTVLDVSAAALAAAQARLGAAAASVSWLESDILEADLAPGAFAVWHDRAVFHFLTDPADRTRYVEVLSHALRDGGHAVIACVAPDGPARCSGLPVMRYDAAGLGRELGSAFELVEQIAAVHRTPGGAPQAFVHAAFRHHPVDGRQRPE